MNLVIIILIAIYLLLSMWELTGSSRGRRKSGLGIRMLPLAGIVLAGAFMLFKQPLMSITELIERKAIPFPASKLQSDDDRASSARGSFGTGNRGIFWYINHYAKRYEVDPLLVRAVIEVESNFDPKAVSRNGAKGLMQINPITAKHLGLNDVFDIGENIEGGVRYLRYLLERYGWNLHMTLASYNAGPANIRRHKGIPPFRETRRYISRIIEVYERLKRTDEVFNDTSRLSALLRQSPDTEVKTDRAIQRQITQQ